MRFVRLLCASFLVACGSGGSSDAGVDATASDASADVTDASTATDVVITDPQCVEAGAACQACCSTVHPDASGIFDTMIAACSCGDAGKCEGNCASTFCSGQASSKACDMCISKQCYPDAKTACNADPNCKAWLACLVPCP